MANTPIGCEAVISITKSELKKLKREFLNEGLKTMNKQMAEDLLLLSKHVYTVSKKYGNKYVTSTCCEGSNRSNTTISDNEVYKDASYEQL